MSHSPVRLSRESSASRDDLAAAAELGELKPMTTEAPNTSRWRDYQSQLYRLKEATKVFIVVAAALFLAVILALAWFLSPRLHSSLPQDLTPFNTMDASTSSLLRELYAPMKIPLLSRVITASNGKQYTLSNVTHETPLKNQVLILDIDNRPFDEEGQILHNETVPWDKLDQQSAGLLNHYTYSLIHGYDYKFLHTPTPSDRFPSWAKPGSIASELLNYKFVIFMDSDAIWNHLELPFEWLLNHWNIGANTSLAISRDWGLCTAVDHKGCLNTGFIVAQQGERTQEILKAWADCPSGVQFPGCEQYAFQRSYDQEAFNVYITLAFTRPGDLMRLPCDDTDGAPGTGVGCEGVFVRHYWGEKGGVRAGFADSIMRAVAGRLHGSFVGNRDELLVDGSDV